MMNRSIWITAGLATLLVSACSSQKDPAEKALEKIDNTMAMIHDSAQKYSADTLPGVQAQVTAIHQTFAKGDYAGVLAQAPAVNTAVSNLRSDAGAKQAAAESELAKVKQQWRTLSAEVPKMVAGLHTQVDSLSSGHALPKGVTKASFATVKDGVTSLDTMWSDASNTQSTGDYAGAVTKGQAVKDKATELMHTLGMKQG
jgi:hypothetical protein